jgi:purine-nucleoside phosphorylase
VNLSRAGWLEAMGLAEADVPRLLILEGTWWERERYPMRLRHLESVRELAFPGMVWGTHLGVPIVFCCAYGAPRAVEPVHAFGSVGCKTVVQIGSCGALQPQVITGDIVLPERAKIGEGASQYYGETEVSAASLELVDAAQRAFEQRGFRVHRGSHLTTSALFAQSPERIQAWRRAGYLGVDMETSAVFSAARHFGMKAASLLFAWDELLEGRSWLDPFAPEEKERQDRANEAIFEVALAMTEVA